MWEIKLPRSFGLKCPWFLLYLALNVTTEIGMTFPCPLPSFSTHSQKQYGHLKSCQMIVIFDTWLDWESNLLKKEPILQDDCQWWDLRKGLWKVLKRVSLGLNTYCSATAQTGRLPALSVLYFLAWRWQPQHGFICKPATVVLQARDGASQKWDRKGLISIPTSLLYQWQLLHRCLTVWWQGITHPDVVDEVKYHLCEDPWRILSPKYTRDISQGSS